MSQFKPIEFYQHKQIGRYRLLPFRFSPFDDLTYLLTNQVGEYIRLPRDEVVRVVKREVLAEEPLYQDLKSKHFIFDDESDLALNLLGLKARTKLHQLSSFTALHMIVVTLRCEHSCPYCQVSRQSEDRSSFDMSLSTADRTLELIFRSPSPSIKIEFQGGEPLLNFELIKHIVREAKRINIEANRDLEFVIATNLALINDEILEFCRSHEILISTSLDGPKELHNRNRPRPGGDSYQRTIAGILKARDVLGKDRVSALMTTSPASIDNVKSIIDEYVALNFDGIFLRSLSPYGFAVKTGWFQSYSTDRWLEFYKEGLDYIIELNRKGVFFVEQHAATLLTKLLTPFDTRFVDLMNPAGIGIAGVIYNYDGDVYPSDEARMIAEMNDKKFRMGNVNKNTYDEIFMSETFLEALESSFTLSAPMCADCAYEPFCGADPVYHYQTQGDLVGHKPSSGFCKKNMSLLQVLIRKLDEDKETRRILYSWVAN